MQPITDKLNISREKLAFIVDSTAAPIAVIAPISSWIGFEIGLIADAFQTEGIDKDPYLTFVYSLPYNFYPILMIIFVFNIILWQKDLGPMLTSERKARSGNYNYGDYKQTSGGEEENFFQVEVVKEEVKTWQIVNAIVPIGSVVIGVILSMVVGGYLEVKDKNEDVSVQNIFSNADSTSSLLIASFSGTIVAAFLLLVQRVFGLGSLMEAWGEGLKMMLEPLMILWFAWGLGEAISDISTAQFMVTLVGDSIDGDYIPVITFLMAAILSFCTGTSWGVMVILFPLAVPLINSLAPGNDRLLYATTASVLSGSVFGDHCSPIADTTILVSLSCKCPLVQHVKTQMPYALFVAVLGSVFGSLFVGLGWYPSYVGIIIPGVLLTPIVFLLGRKHVVPEKIFSKQTTYSELFDTDQESPQEKLSPLGKCNHLVRRCFFWKRSPEWTHIDG